MEDEKGKKSAHAEREEKILQFWEECEIFRKTLDKPSPKGEFVFFEGPPTANGKPGIHHVEARVFKDAIPRYKTMCGYHVGRKAGWDTHGLPVELQVEKQLGMKSKKEIESYGIAEFNKRCKESVLQHIDLWKTFTKRMGYWEDFDNAYFTFDNSYIESLWNIVGKIEKDGLLYKDYKVVPWCPRCGTALSSHELAQGYQDVKDLSVYVKFKVVGQDNNYILAWTTTPWTLPGNLALAVGADIKYAKIKKGGEIFILASKRLSIIEGEYEILDEIEGKDLAGLAYEPLYDFLKGNDKSHQVYAAEFVTTEDGTGIVHTAVMYGADDFVLGTRVGLPKYHLVKEDGTFKEGCGFLAGKFVKDEETAVEIIKDLAHRGLLFKKEKYEHSYPFCWRCKTPLIYYARDSWYIRMSDLRDKMVKENNKINWEPSYIKEGRFGEWLREIKDWAISRERYWGTPLPVWMSEDGSEKLVVDSIQTLKQHTKKSGNNYFVMRHGEAETNVLGIYSSDITKPYGLTDKGRGASRSSALNIKDQGIDLIFSSPLVRTRETAEVVAEALGKNKSEIICDERLREEGFGELSGRSKEEFKETFANWNDRYYGSKFGTESLNDTRRRLAEFLYEIEEKYKDQNILIVSHGGPISLMHCIASGRADVTSAKNAYFNPDNYPALGEIKSLDFAYLPHNDEFELDLHKPYIDNVELVSKDGKELRRVKEVMDVWFDSGAMPFAQDHYPFDTKDIAYPADFISEAIDQTRGWFYTLHAVGALMDKGRAYKNVICLGHLLDKNGKKMSKSLGNIVDPWEEIEKYGIDAIRLWMYSVNQPGESKNYDGKTVDEINKKVFNLLSNVFSFYDLYRDKTLEWDHVPESSHALDQWIMLKLSVLVSEMTDSLESYKLLEPVRAMREFIDDLSTWYLQLSRDRVREGDAGAKQTLYYVLKTLSKLLAPFAPFYAEDLYQKLRVEGDPESVHLDFWPTIVFSRQYSVDSILEDMKKTREIVSLGLDARMKANIKVRQPLAELKVPSTKYQVSSEYTELIKERVNVKNVAFVESVQDVVIDTNITEELREEGIVRELVRFIQDIRKKQGLTPNDRISLNISANDLGNKVISNPKWQNMLKSAVLADDINLNENEGEKLVVENVEFVVSVER